MSGGRKPYRKYPGDPPGWAWVPFAFILLALVALSFR